MRTDDQIDVHLNGTVRIIMRVSKGISEEEATLLACRGLLRYDDLSLVREGHLALRLIKEYAEAHGKSFDDYAKTREEEDEYMKAHPV